MSDDRRKLHLISTGGTISTVAEGGAGARPALAAELIAESLTAGAAGELSISHENLGMRLSSELGMAELFAISLAVRERLLNDLELTAVIVSHGTGTMEESVLLAELLLPDERPVVFTGAMRGTRLPYADGVANLHDAARVAVDSETQGRGALVVLGGEIHRGVEATKASTISYLAFRSGMHGPIGYVYPDRVHYARPVQAGPRLPVSELVTEVDLIKFVVGMDDRYVQASIAAGSRAIVIEGSGLGNVNAALLRGVSDAIEHGLVVAVCSRAAEGRVFGAYATEASASALAEAGCVLSSMSGPKTRIMLMAALAADLDRVALAGLLDPR